VADQHINNPEFIQKWLEKAMEMSDFLTAGIENSRAKDFNDPFRLAMFGNAQEMEKVIGSIHENEFISDAKQHAKNFHHKLKELMSSIKK
jgi:hypothetical protein